MIKIIIICEATKKSGLGHLYRSMRVAESLRNLARVTLLVNSDFSDMPQLSDGICVAGLTECREKLASFSLTSQDIIWCDLSDEHYCQIDNLRISPATLVSTNMFEKAQSRRYEDISFFPCFQTTRRHQIENPPYTLQFSGVDSIVVDPSFFCKQKPDSETVLVTMGGADPMKFTELVLRAIAKVPMTSMNFSVVLPKKNNNVEAYAQYRSLKNVKFLEFGNFNFSEALKKSKYAIINGGMTRYECIASKTYFIALSIHKAQFELTEKVSRFGHGINFGVFDASSVIRLTSTIVELAELKQTCDQTRWPMSPQLRPDSANWAFQKIIEEKGR